MPIQFFNYASTSLAIAINSFQTTITVAVGAQFPLSPGNTFYATIIDQASYSTNLTPPAQREIVLVTAVVGNVLTVQRGVDGTSPQSFLAGSQIECRVNAASLLAIVGSGGNYIAPFTGAITRTTVNKLADTVSVRDFGAVGNGVVDDTIAIQAALNSGAGYIIFPNSSGVTSYRITSTLICNTSKCVIDGQGSILAIDEAAGVQSIFQIGNGVTPRDSIVLTDFLLGRYQVATVGAAVDFRLAGQCRAIRINVNGENKVFRGISLTSCSEIWIDSCIVDGVREHAIYCVGVLASKCGDIRIYDSLLQNGASDSIMFDNYTFGVYVYRNVIFNNNGFGAKCSPSVVGQNISYKFQQNDFDSCVFGGVYIMNTSNVQVNDNWISNVSGVSCQQVNGSVGLVLSGNQIYTNGSFDACDIGGAGVVIVGNLFSGGRRHIYNRVSASQVTIADNFLGFSSGASIDNADGPNIVTISGNTFTTNGSNYNPGGTNIVMVGNNPTRSTGWTSPTGTVSRATFDQSTVTLPQLAQRVAALIEDLMSQGIISP